MLKFAFYLISTSRLCIYADHDSIIEICCIYYHEILNIEIPKIITVFLQL